MKNELVELTPDQASKLVNDEEVATLIISGSGGPVFKLHGNSSVRVKNDSLVDFELALRKCEKNGVFEKRRQ